MTNLSDTQRILLASAAQRDNGSLLPLPAILKSGGGTTKAVAALLKRGLAEERETSDPAAAYRTEGDVCYGVFITPAGAAAIGVEPEEAAGAGGAASRAPALPASPAPKAPSKAAAVVTLLTRPDGATLSELIEATCWLPHTTRAALTGLRKKGHAITRGKRDGATCYHIAGEA